MKKNVLNNKEECSQEHSGESTTKIRMFWQCHHITAITLHTYACCHKAVTQENVSRTFCISQTFMFYHPCTSKRNTRTWDIFMKEGNSCTWLFTMKQLSQKGKDEENVLRTFFTWKKHIFATLVHQATKGKEHMGCSFSYRLRSCIWVFISSEPLYHKSL